MSSCSCGSSLSSDSLERRVPQHHLLDKVRALQERAAGLRTGIAGGKVYVGHVREALGEMLQEHRSLASSVSSLTAALERVNRETGGRTAGHIASSQTSLAAELRVLAEQLSSLEEILRNGCGLSWSPQQPPNESSCLAITADDERDSPTMESGGCGSTTSEEDRNSLRLPDIYLTPSRPAVSTPSTSGSAHSLPSSSPPSSLSHFDPFTPDTPSAPPSREHSGVWGAHPGVSATLTPLQRPAGQSVSDPRVSVGGDCGRGSSSSVLQWLMGTSHHSSGENSEEEEVGGCEGEVADCGHVETTDSAAVGSPLSPPISSPRADSGISSSTHTHHLSPPPLSVTMSDIEAMRAELAALREEIRNTSNWSPSLSLAPMPPLTHTVVPCTQFPRPQTNFFSAGARTTHSKQTSFPTSSTPTVPRPNHSRSYSRTSMTPISGSSSLSSHRRLFSSPHTAMHTDSHTAIRPNQLTQSNPRLVDHSVQTIPFSIPNIGTKTRNGTDSIYHPHSSSFTLPHHLSSLPHNFTPHLILHTSHHPSLHQSHTLTPSHLSQEAPEHLVSSHLT